MLQQSLNEERLLVLPVAAELAEVSALSNFFLLDDLCSSCYLSICPTHYAGDFGWNMLFKTIAKIRIVQSI